MFNQQLVIHRNLYDPMGQAPSARVVVVSSTAHLGATKELMEGQECLEMSGFGGI